jgi:hypothetical protein
MAENRNCPAVFTKSLPCRISATHVKQFTGYMDKSNNVFCVLSDNFRWKSGILNFNICRTVSGIHGQVHLSRRVKRALLLISIAANRNLPTIVSENLTH